MGKVKALSLFLLLLNSLYAKEDYILIKDILNREVKVKKDVKRVIALGTSLSYITYLDASDKIIAIESIDLKDIRKRTYTYVNKERLKKLPVVAKGAKSKQLNLEMLISLKPDVIFTIMHNKSELEELSSKLKIPMVALSYGRGTIELETIFKSFSIAGKVLNKEKRADELISYIKDLQQSFKKPNKKKEAYIGAISHKGFQGLNSTQADFIPFTLAKVNNSASKIKNKGHMFVNEEFLLSYNPKNIFVDSTGWEIIQANFHKNNEYYKKIQAFKKEKVYMLLANACK